MLTRVETFSTQTTIPAQEIPFSTAATILTKAAAFLVITTKQIKVVTFSESIKTPIRTKEDCLQIILAQVSKEAADSLIQTRTLIYVILPELSHYSTIILVNQNTGLFNNNMNQMNQGNNMMQGQYNLNIQQQLGMLPQLQNFKSKDLYNKSMFKLF